MWLGVRRARMRGEPLTHLTRALASRPRHNESIQLTILPWKRFFAFGGLQLVGAISPLLVLPVVVRLIGVDGWVGLSLGYAVGGAAGVAVNYGWPITGPSRVAAVSQDEAATIFAESLFMRATVALPVLAIAVLTACLLTPEGYRGLAGAMTVAMASYGLAPNWYYIGRGKPEGILRYEVLPKLAATVATIPLVLLTQLPLIYPILLLAATMSGVIISARRILSGHQNFTHFAPGLRSRYASYGLVAASMVLGAGYSILALPITQMAGTSLAQVANFAGSMRMRSMVQTGITAGTSALQGWVSEQDQELSRRHRMRLALLTNAGLGAFAGLLLFSTGPLLGGALFGDAAELSYTLSALTGLACVPYALGTSLSFHILAPLQRTRVVATSRILATVVGVPLIFVMTRAGGANGAAAAILISESVVVLLQGFTVYRASLQSRRVKAALQT